MSTQAAKTSIGSVVEEKFRVGEVRVSPLCVDQVLDPENTAGQSAGDFFGDLIESHGITLQDKDILAISSKVAGFFEGSLVRLADVRPSRKARFLGWAFRKDPRKVQLIMESGRVMAVIPLKRITRIPSVWHMMETRSPNPEAMRQGFEKTNNFVFIVRMHACYLDEAGIDHTNSPEEFVTILPDDACITAAGIRTKLMERFGCDVAVIITDTATSLGRIGSQDVAIGYAGIDPITRQTFSDDLFGAARSGGLDIVIDSVAGIAGLVMGQTTEKTPAALIRGVEYLPERDDEPMTGMAALAYPPDSEWRMGVYTVWSTLCFYVANLLSFQRWPRKGRRSRKP